MCLTFHFAPSLAVPGSLAAVSGLAVGRTVRPATRIRGENWTGKVCVRRAAG
jgi:hypothetical protein